MVHEALRAAILDGSLPAGERLRQEDVARRWDVSATPVREAFRRLESEGLVAYEANRGVVVQPPGPRDGTDGLERLARRWRDLLTDPEALPGSDFP